MKKYICSICNRVFYTRGRIREHVQEVHNKKGIEGYYGNNTEITPVSITYISKEMKDDNE